MCRKLFLLASLVMVLGLVSSASAGPTWIGTVSRAWGTGGNWTGGAVPGTADQPFVGWHNTTTVPFTPLVSTETISVDKFNIGGTDKQGYLEMTGGSLAVGTTGVYIGNSSRSAMAKMDMSGGLFSSGKDWRVGRRSLATFYQTGGTLDVVKYKPGARTHDPAAQLMGQTNIRHMGGLVNADYIAFYERVSVHLGNATMVIDGTAGAQAASDIDAEIDAAIAAGRLKPYGIVHGTTIGAVTYEIVKSWDFSGEILTVTAVPEPATIALLGLGGLALLRRRR
jgi:hypothetical protein